MNYRYVLTEDQKPGPFGKVNGPKTPGSRTFYLQGNQRAVAVGTRNGILRLTRRLTFLPKRRDGIRRITIKIIVKTGYWSKRNYKIKVELIIFPLKFGDPSLRKFGKKLRAGVVKRSNTFARSGTTANSLHRFLRVIAPKVNPNASEDAFSSIEGEKITDLALKDIIRQYVSNKSKSS